MTSFTALVGDAQHQVAVEALGDGRWRVSIDGRDHVVDSRETSRGSFSLLIEHAAAEVSVTSRGEDFQVVVGGRTHRLRLLDERAMRRRERSAAVDGWSVWKDNRMRPPTSTWTKGLERPAVASGVRANRSGPVSSATF